jgi:hypothetical protein
LVRVLNALEYSVSVAGNIFVRMYKLINNYYDDDNNSKLMMIYLKNVYPADKEIS